MSQSFLVRILFFLDQAADFEGVQSFLKEEHIEFVPRIVCSHASFWEALAEFQPDILVLDSSCLEDNVTQILQSIRAKDPEIKIFVLGDSADEELIVNSSQIEGVRFLYHHHLEKIPAVICEELKSGVSFTTPKSEQKNIEEINAARIHLMQFAYTHTLESLLQETMDQICALTGSEIGFYHFLEADQETILLQNWSTRTLNTFCKAEGSGYHYNLAQAGVWADCIRERRPIIHNDYASLSHRKGLPEGHAQVIRELVVPVIRNSRIVAILGVGNKAVDYDQKDIEIVSNFADLAWDIADRKRMEMDLQKSEARFRSFVENANDVVYVVDQDGNFTYVSPKWKELLGHEPQDVIGKSFKEFVYPDDIPACQQFLEQILTTGEKQSGIEYRVRHKNGEWHWHVSNGSLILDSDYQTRHFLGIGRDITERKQAEEKLLASETSIRRKLKAIMEPDGDLGALELGDIIDQNALQALMDDFYQLTHVGIGIIDMKGKILVAKGWQTICTRFFRAHPETLKNCIESDTILTQSVIPGTFKQYKCKNNMWDISTPIMLGGKHLGNIFLGQFFYDDDIPDEEMFRKQARQYGFDEEAYLNALAEVPRWSHDMVASIMQFYTRLAGMISSLNFANINLSRSLAEKEQLFAKLSESEERYRVLIDTSPMAIMVMRQGKYIYANPAGLNLLGYADLNEFVGLNVMDTIHPDSRPLILERIKNTAQGNANPAVEMMVLRKNGDVVYTESTSIPIKLNGEPVVLIISRNITERRQAEQKARQNENRLRSLYEISQYEARNIQDLLDYSLNAAIQLTESKIGYIYFYNEATQEFTLNSWSKEVMHQCTVAEPQTIYQLEKTGLWGEAVRQRRPIIHNDFHTPDPCAKGYPEGHVILERFLTIPVMIEHAIVAVVGVANKESDYNDTDILQLSLLMSSVWKIVQRKRAEDTIRESAEQLQMMISTSLDGFLVLNQNGKILDVNEAYCRMIGYTRTELLALSIHDLEITEKSEDIAIHMQKIIHYGSDRFETRHQRKDGHAIDLEVSTTYIPSRGWYLSFLRDITARQRAMQALRESESRFKAVAEYSHNAICLIDERAKIIWMNEAFIQLGGYSRDQIYAAASFAEFLAPESFEFVVNNFNCFVRNEPYEHHYSFYIVCANGQKRLCEKYMTDYKDRFGNRILAISMLDITERKRIEDALRLSEEKFSTAFRISPDSININRLTDGMYIEINEGFTGLTGYTPEEVIGKTSLEINIWVNPQDRERLVKGLRAHGEVWNLEAPFRVKNGGIKICLMSARIIELNQEKCILSITRDITERKQAEEALRASEEKYRLLIENQQDMLVKTDTQGNILYVNPVYCDVFGKTEKELLGTSYVPLVHPDDLPVIEKAVALLFVPPFQCRYEERANTCRGWRWLSWTAKSVLDEQGAVVALIGSGRDITEQKQAEEALRLSEERLRLAQEAANAGAWEWNLRTDVNTWSDKLWALYGLEPNSTQATFDSWLQSIHPDDRNRVEQAVTKTAANGEELNVEWRVNHPDGKEHWLMSRGKPFRDVNGQIDRYAGVVMDITERKQAEAQLTEQLEELQRWHHVTLGREERIVELKREVNKLLMDAGKPPRYASVQD